MRIVPALDEIEDRQRSFVLILEPTRGEQLAFQRGIETLGRRVIETVANRSHRWLDSGVSFQLGFLFRCVYSLTALRSSSTRGGILFAIASGLFNSKQKIRGWATPASTNPS